ncbi:MAG: UvrD-helicase domain-containing protein, partial [Candidatus Thermoplasmatota archaeon]|nr:UvrD-helicase domain-containing protein [Candidatus Thermoplasmatota archaeon]
MEAPIRTDTIVVASPGTGKTQEIANTVIGLLRSGVSSERIACMTFTNRAAREMIQRIISVAGEDPEILRSIYTLDIGTMHSLAYGEDESGQPGLVSNSLLRFIIYRKIIELGTFTYSPDTIRHMIIPKLENMIRYVKSFGIYPDEIDIDRTMGILLERLKQEEKEDMGEPEYHRLLQDFIILFSHYG